MSLASHPCSSPHRSFPKRKLPPRLRSLRGHEQARCERLAQTQNAPLSPRSTYSLATVLACTGESNQHALHQLSVPCSLNKGRPHIHEPRQGVSAETCVPRRSCWRRSGAPRESNLRSPEAWNSRSGRLAGQHPPTRLAKRSRATRMRDSTASGVSYLFSASVRLQAK